MIKDFDIFDRFDLFGGGAGSGKRTRYFTELTAAGSQHYTIPTVTLTGDFEVEVEFSTTTTTNQILMGDSHAASYYFNFDVSKFTVWIAGIQHNYLHTAYTPHDGKLHKIKYKLVGTSLELFLDDISLGSLTVVPYTGSNSFVIGNSNANNAYFNGIISNVKITDAGTLVRQYDIKETWLNDLVLYDNVNDQHGLAVNITSADAEKYSFDSVDQAWLGGELGVNGGFDADTDWTKGTGWTISGGTASSDGTQVGDSDLSDASIVVSGFVYRHRFSIESVSAGGVTPVLGTQLGTQRTAVGSYSENITANATSLINRADLNFVGDIDDVSVKRFIELA